MVIGSSVRQQNGQHCSGDSVLYLTLGNFYDFCEITLLW